ncbi:PAS domain S-box protein [Sphingomonas sp. RP10(2022)]|uniref:histidine kinase n=1 Tax=Sphingomonas liriopis TaxID=2949094 RepID=A0A9X2HXN4_9SPHN|nr:PAS domain S-box protein [Sphingomonas liriopis]MCP3733950.1 PAS domain S-box protein [Sphingomonas liriopis]
MDDAFPREARRLAALSRYAVLDTPSEPAFDEIASLAAAICGAPIAIVNFIGDGRQYFKAEVGLGVRSTPLETSFCVRALLEEDFLLIPDAAADPCFANSPLVAGEPHLRFYAGALLKTGDGHPIGTLCVLDHRPRDLDAVQQQALRTLARQVMTALDLRLAAMEAERERARHRAIVDSARDAAIIVTDMDGRITDWSAGAEAIFARPEADMVGQSLAVILADDDAVAVVAQTMRDAVAHGGAGVERWYARGDGERFRASGTLSPLRDADGRHRGFVQTLRDRTEDNRATTALAEAKGRLRWAQEAGGVGIFEVGEDGVLHGTPEFCRLYGLDVCETLPATAFEALVVAEDRHLVSAADTRAAGTAPLDVEYRIRRADTGELRWIARRGEIQRDATGHPIGFAGVALDITDRVRTREALAAERELLAQMFEQAPTFMALLEGPEHRFARANPGYTRLVDHRDVIGRTVAEVLPDAAAQGYVALLDGVYRTGVPYAASGLHYAVQAGPDEPVHDRYVDFVYQPIRNASGAVTGIFVEGADVTDRTLAAAAARDAEERYRTVVEAIDVGFCVIEIKFDADGVAVDYRLVEGNPAFERQTGLVDWLGKWVSEVAPGLEQHWFDRYGHVARTGEPAHFENPADVFGRWYDVRAIRTGDPADHRVAIFFSDISDRKTMEERLRRLNASLSDQVEARTQDRDRMWRLSTDVMLVAGFDGRVAAVNPAWSTLLGWDAEELIGDDFLTLVHPDDRDATVAEVGKLESGRTTLRFENRYRHRDGSYSWISWTAVPDDRFIHAVGRDITGEREQAAALMRTEEALRQAQKMEAVGQLTGGIAHDFNNMLTGVIGSLDLVQRYIASGRMDRVDRYIEAANSSAQRAAALTARLLAFGRRQSLDLQSIDVNALVTGIESLLHSTLGEQVALDTRLAVPLAPAHTDANQLENALLNLCINARDAMPDGGRLTIATADVHLDARYASEHAEVEPGDYVMLSVADTGTGMSAETVEKVFEPFFTTKPVGQGTGLGLSMIYGFVRQSGGHVRIESELGRGTTIRLYIPRFEGEAQPARAEPREAPAGAGETVMIVEDDAAVRLIVREVLEELRYQVVEADDARTAIPILQSPRRIDLLVSDVGLPGMNGRQLAEIARQSRPELQILFVTGYAENAAVRGGFLDHGMEMMTKPFAVDALATRIRGMLGNR